MWNYILPPLLLLTSVFMILLVLIQRGRGGGLAGAFGGLGGQSAFGTKAGDLFTRITIGVATFWIILCAASVSLLNDSGSGLINSNLGGAAPPVGQQPGGALPTGTPPVGTPPAGAPAQGTPPAAAPATEPAPTDTPAAAAPAATEPAPAATPAAEAPPADKPAEPGNK